MKLTFEWLFGDYIVKDANDYGITLARINFTKDAKEWISEEDLETAIKYFVDNMEKSIKKIDL